jgi:hypothetical protein
LNKIKAGMLSTTVSVNCSKCSGRMKVFENERDIIL